MTGLQRRSGNVPARSHARTQAARDRRVLATGPRLMLLDEALGRPHPAELQQAIALVRKIHERGITLVIVDTSWK